ncbi:DNA-binding protein YbiB [Acidiferrobacter sp.]|uniref:DNA-binding protein YbiB n=1 Tax=Acidiferrobacter sp. TaxID=1872107 RepID=UPI0026249137|nr:DNA-binding protein YbiB [Acidiferrobacter sp.]
MHRDPSPPMPAAIPADDLTAILKAIARGPDHATDLSRETAHALFAAWLAGGLPPVVQGALWTALRLKGESTDELLGFVAATEETLAPVAVPSRLRPVVFAAYNGARHHANLLPLLALLLSREGVPVLIHGAYGGPAAGADWPDPAPNPARRITTGEILAALGLPPVANREAVPDHIARHHLAYIPIDILHPRLAAVLSLHHTLGVRSSVHNVIKLFNPCTRPAVLCAAVSHPPYLARLGAFFMATGTTALILRGTEGEPVAHPKRRPALIGVENGHQHEWFAEDRAPLAEVPDLPSDRSAGQTARFIEEVLAGRRRAPRAISDQAACLLVMSGAAPDLATACARLGVSHDPAKPQPGP